MKSMVRGVLAVLAGFVVASLVMVVVESLNGRVFYPGLAKQAEGVTDRETIRQILASAPVGALVVVLVGWALGSLLGGMLAARIGKSSPVRHTLALGVVLTLAGIANNLMLPPPMWFRIAGLLVFVPAAYLGSRLVASATRSVPAVVSRDGGSGRN